MLSLLKEILYAPYSVVKGLMITIVHMFRPKVTLQYPDQRWELPENYRGIPALPVDAKTGADKCIACGACGRICPEQIITITSEVGEDKKRKLQDFTLDASRCMWCGLCTEVCPPNALVMSKDYELATNSREGMVFHLDDMHKHGGTFPAVPEPEPKPEPETKPEAEAQPADQQPTTNNEQQEGTDEK